MALVRPPNVNGGRCIVFCKNRNRSWLFASKYIHDRTKLIADTGQSLHKKLHVARNSASVELIAVTNCVLEWYMIVPPQ